MPNICAHVESVNDIFVKISYYLEATPIREADVRKDEIGCKTPFAKGDCARLMISNDQITKLDFWSQPANNEGKVTEINEQYGIINDKFYFENKFNNFQVNDLVKFEYVSGNYLTNQKKPYRLRALNIQSKKIQIDREADKVRFKKCMPFDYFYDQRYDLPDGLYDEIISTNAKNVLKKLDEILPNEPLCWRNYGSRMHNFLYLEEIENKRAFTEYVCKANIKLDKNSFYLNCDYINELRPPISTGDDVCLVKVSDLHQRSHNEYRARIDKVTNDRFILKFTSNDFEKDYDPLVSYHVKFHYNRIIYKRKHSGIDAALAKFDSEFLFPTVFNVKSPQLNVEVFHEKLTLNGDVIPWFNDQLNTEQKIAVQQGLRNEFRPLPFIVFGPPGTGKTLILVEMILQIYTHNPNSRILVATQSNSPANLIASKLCEKANIDISLLRLVSNITIDKKKIPKQLHRMSASVAINVDEFDIDHELSEIKRNRDISYIKEFRVVISTCCGIGIVLRKKCLDDHFTHVFIDEAGQCNEPDALIPLSLLNVKEGAIIMAGDPNQLSPIVFSNHGKDRGYAESLLTRYTQIYENVNLNENKNGEDFDSRLVVKLLQNYRSLPSILKFYSDQFYKSQLIAKIESSGSAEATELSYLCSHNRIFARSSTTVAQSPFGLHFINVDGQNTREKHKKSWANYDEAKAVRDLVQKLLKYSNVPNEIGIITPYFAQVMLIKKFLLEAKIDIERINIGTVEEFQGEERKIILISGVKTSGTEVGLRFVYNAKRLNTAISRARVLAVIFANANVFSRDNNWNDLIGYCKENKTFHSYNNSIIFNDD